MSKKRGGNRLKYQVEQAIKKITMLNVSKKALRDAGKETGIHSTNQIQEDLSVSQNFVKWAREQGVKDLFQLKRSHYRDYIAHKQAEGVSNGHLINIETGLRHLEKGMKQISKEKGFTERNWTPKTRLINSSDRGRPQDRSCSSGELKGYLNKLSANAHVGGLLQSAFGLRLREAAYTVGAHIVEEDGKLFWRASNDKQALNTAKGITKAGRGRTTPCNPEYEQQVRELIEGKGEDEFVVPVKYNTLKSAYYRAGMKGSHAFRHTYAREMLRKELQARGIEREGRAMIQRMVENREAGYRRDHLVTREERPLYREVSAAMDQVQNYLGHGSGRIDLAEVYLKGI